MELCPDHPGTRTDERPCATCGRRNAGLAHWLRREIREFASEFTPEGTSVDDYEREVWDAWAEGNLTLAGKR